MCPLFRACPCTFSYISRRDCTGSNKQNTGSNGTRPTQHLRLGAPNKQGGDGRDNALPHQIWLESDGGMVAFGHRSLHVASSSDDHMRVVDSVFGSDHRLIRTAMLACDSRINDNQQNGHTAQLEAGLSSAVHNRVTPVAAGHLIDDAVKVNCNHSVKKLAQTGCRHGRRVFQRSIWCGYGTGFEPRRNCHTRVPSGCC